jgi:hypothetical protein
MCGAVLKNVVMSSLILLMVLPAMSFASSWAPVEEGVAVSGKVHAIKKTKKYRSVEKCRAYAETKSVVVAFTLDANKGTCSTYTSVRSRPAKEGAISQVKG